MLDDVAVKTERGLSSALERIKSSAKILEEANARVAHTLAAFGNEVEEARAKLTKVKTPDELVSVRLKPTLTTLEKLVTAHAKALAASDQGRADQAESLQQTLEKLVTAHAKALSAFDQGRGDQGESLQQTQRSVDGVITAVDRVLLAMEKHVVEFCGPLPSNLAKLGASDKAAVRCRSRAH